MKNYSFKRSWFRSHDLIFCNNLCIMNLRNWQQITYHTLSFMSLVWQQCQLKYLLTAELMEPHSWICFHSKIDVCTIVCTDNFGHQKIFLNTIYPSKMEISEREKIHISLIKMSSESRKAHTWDGLGVLKLCYLLSRRQCQDKLLGNEWPGF